MVLIVTWLGWTTGQKCASCDGHRRSVAKKSSPTAEVRGGGKEELPHSRGQGLQPRGATPPLRSAAKSARL